MQKNISSKTRKKNGQACSESGVRVFAVSHLFRIFVFRNIANPKHGYSIPLVLLKLQTNGKVKHQNFGAKPPKKLAKSSFKVHFIKELVTSAPKARYVAEGDHNAKLRGGGQTAQQEGVSPL